MVKDAKAVGNFVKEHKEQILAGVKIVGSIVETAVGAAMIASGVGDGLGAALVAYGVNGIISGGADMYYASTGQKDKIGTVNPLKDIFQGVLGKQVGGAAFETSDFVLGMVGGGGELKTATKATEYVAEADKAIEAVNTGRGLEMNLQLFGGKGDKLVEGAKKGEDTLSKLTDVSEGTGEAVKGAETTAIQTYYPPNNGALGAVERKYLMPGDKIDRFGKLGGKYFSPIDTPMEMRALPSNASLDYRAFEVVKPFEVEMSTIAPAYNQIGLGTQFRSPVSAEILLKRGIIK